MSEISEKIIATLNEQKGEMVGINAMLAAMARSLPQEHLARLLAEFDTELAYARSHLGNSPVPDEVISGLENYVKMWNAIRRDTNHS